MASSGSQSFGYAPAWSAPALALCLPIWYNVSPLVLFHSPFNVHDRNSNCSVVEDSRSSR